MQITVVDVGQPNTHAGANGRSYQSLEVMYKGVDGKVGSKKLMSFSNPSVFNTAKSWGKGDVVDVITQKDDKGYWQWTGIGQGNGDSQQVQSKPQASASTGTRVTGSNYETKEERADRQRLIVRQSSLNNAIAILTVGAKTVDKNQVLGLAQELADWVFTSATANNIPDITEIEDDIPV